MIRRPPRSTPLSLHDALPIYMHRKKKKESLRTLMLSPVHARKSQSEWNPRGSPLGGSPDRKSTRLNSSHANISYAVFCLKKKNYSHHLTLTITTLTSIQTTHS